MNQFIRYINHNQRYSALHPENAHSAPEVLVRTPARAPFAPCQPLDQFAADPYHEEQFWAVARLDPSVCGVFPFPLSGALPVTRRGHWQRSPAADSAQVRPLEPV